MKTIEEKAKTYDIALERAKAYHRNELTGSRKEMMEYIFPQLLESEDERMMREFNDWLCEEIECRTNDLRNEKDRRTLNMLCYVLTKVKDWLEKQEQKPAWSEKDEKTINELCDIIASNAKNGYLGGCYAPDLIEKIKSLRPSWKPTPEQLEALHTAAYLPEMEFYGGLKYKLRELDKQLKGHRI